MTSHPSFEARIFNGGSLSPEERGLLDEHLSGCSHCAALSTSWKALEPQLKDAAPFAPVSGFSNRWKARLAEDDLARRNRQVWWSLGGLLAGATLFLVLIAGALISSPIQLAGDMLKTFSLVGLQLQIYLVVAVEMVERLPGPSPAVWGVAAAAAFSAALAGLMVMWVAAWIQLSVQTFPKIEGGIQ